MKSCKDCVHLDACHYWYSYDNYGESKEEFIKFNFADDCSIYEKKQQDEQREDG